MNSLIEYIIEKTPTSKLIEDIFIDLKKNKVFRIGELSVLGKIIMISLLKKKTPKIVVISSRSLELKSFLYQLQLEFANAEDISKLASTGLSGIFILDQKEAFQKVIPLSDFYKHGINLAVNTKNNPIKIIEQLSDIGYQRVKKPSDRREFNMKGDTLEIVMDDKKYKISFFGDNIEDISCFDIDSDRKNGKKIKTLSIFPLAIQEGDSYLLNYFEDFTFLIDGEDSFRSGVFSFFQKDDGQISEDEVEEIKKVEEFLKKQPVLYLEDFAVGGTGGINFHWLGPKKYHGNTSDFLRDLKSNRNSSKTYFIFSDKAEQIKKFLANNSVDLSNIHIESKKIEEGASLENLGIEILSDKEIFGEAKKISKKKKLDFSALTNLKKGEYVVHIDHGIGVFTGFGEIEIDKVKREYIFIGYDGGDSIYVPLDQADKITKYIAVGNSAPHLSSLKTGQWVKIRKKVSENAEKIAKELLETQALRAGEKKFYYIDDSREQSILKKTFRYRETEDQEKCIAEVLEDMNGRSPMDRLLCGDVGYGKTEVAVRAILRAVVSGGQVAVLVPTTILAEQHLQTFRERLDQFGFRVESLSRFRSAKEQEKVIEKLETGGVDVVIGTHRLLSKDVKFKNLSLVIIDEEQKFGVKHKEQLKKLRSGCDILTMTATPIPRTLYLGLGGLKDISLINTPPEGRLPIKTVVIKNEESVIAEAIKKEVERGGQVYFVHNRVQTINAVEAKLKKLLPKVRFVVGHGQMSDEILAHVMNDFAHGEYDVLICSTIIESGLDISTVNTLIVDKATNFGLSQLHQLRGRIGRSYVQAYAYFLFDNEDLKGNAKRRLTAISEKEQLGSGYELSLEDLDIRGSGNILGEDQHGSMQMVGVGYYLKLLGEAVEKLKGEQKNVHISDIKIDLPISSFIPDGFYKNSKGTNSGEEEKIRAYQVLAGMEDEESLKEFEINLEKINKEIPAEFKNLLQIVRLKIRSKDLGIKSIIVKDVLGMGERKVKKLYIDFDHVLSKDEVRDIFAIDHRWYFGNMLVRVDLEDLGDEWLRKVFAVLDNLNK